MGIVDFGFDVMHRFWRSFTKILLFIFYFVKSIRVLFQRRRPWSSGQKIQDQNTIPTLAIGCRPLSACRNRQFHTLPGLLDRRTAPSNSYPNVCVSSREAVCNISMNVFGMTWPGREPATHRMRGGYANH